MGKLADQLNEKSKNDDRLIVGSEIRAALAELWQECVLIKNQLDSCDALIDDQTCWKDRAEKAEAELKRIANKGVNPELISCSHKINSESGFSSNPNDYVCEKCGLDLRLNETYDIYINERLAAYRHTVDDVWKFIGEQPFGSRYSIGSVSGHPVGDFVPF